MKYIPLLITLLLACMPVGALDLEISFTESPEATSYTIYRSDLQPIPLISVTRSPAFISMQDDWLCGWFQVRARNAGGQSALSAKKYFKLSQVTPTPAILPSPTPTPPIAPPPVSEIINIRAI